MGSPIVVSRHCSPSSTPLRGARVRIPAGTAITRPVWLSPQPYRLQRAVVVSVLGCRDGRVTWGDTQWTWSAGEWETVE